MKWVLLQVINHRSPFWLQHLLILRPNAMSTCPVRACNERCTCVSILRGLQLLGPTSYKDWITFFMCCTVHSAILLYDCSWNFTRIKDKLSSTSCKDVSLYICLLVMGNSKAVKPFIPNMTFNHQWCPLLIMQLLFNHFANERTLVENEPAMEETRL